jgi:hypothetical protein
MHEFEWHHHGYAKNALRLLAPGERCPDAPKQIAAEIGWV